MAEKRLTVLQMLPALEGGGVERGTLEVAAALVKVGHRSLVMSAGGRMVSELKQAGSEHFTWAVNRKSPWTLRLIWLLRKFLLEQQVDILHYRSRVPGWVAYLAWRGMDPTMRPRLISTVHGLHSVSAYSAVMTKGERVIAVSDTVRRYILDNYPNTPEERVQLIYRGVDPQEFPWGYQPSQAWINEWRSSYPQLQGKRVYCLPGRITRLKGHFDFLDVIEGVRDAGVPVVGLIVGGEDPRRKAYAESLRQAVADRGLQAHILFTGHRTDMREIYSQCDAVLSLSSKPESFGRTVLEALALGVPVVGYDHGGVGEVLNVMYPSGKVGVFCVDETVRLLVKLSQETSASKLGIGENGYLLSGMLKSTLQLYAECWSQ